MLERIKLLLGIDDDVDDLLNEIITLVSDKITSYIKEDTVPKTLEWLLIELCINRYNRIGSEGVSIENINGANIQYEDLDETYKFYLDKYLKDKKSSESETEEKGWCLF